ncbi:MAG: glutathione S-transferase family protein, partial [Steroidobacteraceae bacterium]
MLELYHWEPNGASARVLIGLEEKAIGYTSRYVDLLALEQFRPQFLRVEATGEVPALVHDGAVLTGASPICEYLEERFPAHALMPCDARGRWQVRVWQKLVDDGFAASVSDLAWDAYGPSGSSPLARGVLDAEIAGIGSPEQRVVWQTARAAYG